MERNQSGKIYLTYFHGWIAGFLAGGGDNGSKRALTLHMVFIIISGVVFALRILGTQR